MDRKLKQLTPAVLVALTAAWMPAGAQTRFRFYLANQSDSTQGLTLFLQGTPNASGMCPLSSVSLVLSVGDGAGFHRVSASRTWQPGVVYTAKAVISASGPQQLSLNGQSLGTAQAAFKPVDGMFLGSDAVNSGTPGYVVRQ